MDSEELFGRLYEIVKWDYVGGKEPNRGHNLSMDDYISFLIEEGKHHVKGIEFTCMDCGELLIDGFCPECDMKEPI